ncbi:MAG: cell division protein ZapE [Gammaproteobacteria bacterium WSBS_2016_MAG_OTU1]
MPLTKDRCLLGDNSIIAWHQELVQDGVLFADTRQTQAVAQLQSFADNVLSAPANATTNGGLLSRFFARPPDKNNTPRGIYLHGGVGRGKSFLMDGFYLQLQMEKKMRAHFHQFIRRFHEDMKKHKGEKESLIAIADNISAQFDIVCFDEFHVSDIADAMILGRILSRLFDNGTNMIMTSNYAPSQLYPNGLARDRFLPAIAMLEQQMEVFALDGEEDYRLRHIADEGKVYFEPHDEVVQKRLQNLFDVLACGISLPPSIKIDGRKILAEARSSDAIWFSFSQLCSGAVGQGDYLNLAGRFATIMLSEVPQLDDPNIAEAVRRFTWLVDILYDQRVTLIISAQTPLNELYGNSGGGESGRTLSRLIEMQSAEYWGASLSAHS